MELLPEELLLKIGRGLSSDDLLGSMSASETLGRVFADKSLWRSGWFLSHPVIAWRTTTPLSQLAAIHSFGQFFRSLKLTLYAGGVACQIRDSLLSHASFSQLEELDVNVWGWGCAASSGRKTRPSGAQVVLGVLNKAAGLRKLVVRDWPVRLFNLYSLDFAAPVCLQSTLTTLDLSCLNKEVLQTPSSEDLSKFISFFQSVKHLSIKGALLSLTLVESLTQKKKGIPQLATLRVHVHSEKQTRWCPDSAVTAAAWAALVAANPELDLQLLVTISAKTCHATGHDLAGCFLGNAAPVSAAVVVAHAAPDVNVLLRLLAGYYSPTLRAARYTEHHSGAMPPGRLARLEEAVSSFVRTRLPLMPRLQLLSAEGREHRLNNNNNNGSEATPPPRDSAHDAGVYRPAWWRDRKHICTVSWFLCEDRRTLQRGTRREWG